MSLAYRTCIVGSSLLIMAWYTQLLARVIKEWFTDDAWSVVYFIRPLKPFRASIPIRESHNRTAQKTKLDSVSCSLTSYLFSKRQQCSVYILFCVLVLKFFPLSAMFVLDFGTVLTVWYCVFFYIGFWNCFDSVVFCVFLYRILELFWQCDIVCVSIGFWNCSDSVILCVFL